jgi:hypothetical protein
MNAPANSATAQAAPRSTIAISDDVCRPARFTTLTIMLTRSGANLIKAPAISRCR